MVRSVFDSGLNTEEGGRNTISRHRGLCEGRVEEGFGVRGIVGEKAVPDDVGEDGLQLKRETGSAE